MMTFEPPLIPATLLKRYKRFLADVRLADGTVVTAHCANSGSMRGCLPEGAPVLLSFHDDPKRKLKYSWELVQVGATWVGINTSRPNGIVHQAIAAGQIPELTGYAQIVPEQKYGVNSRIDLLLTAGDGRRCFVEVKNVTLADGPIARFPDSVTTRGAKHLRELAAQVAEGDRAVMLYLVQRGDCDRFEPAAEIDPAYAAGMREAAAAGVELLCYACEVTPSGVRLSHRLPIALSGA